MAETRVTTVRLPEDLVADAEVVCRADGITLSELVRCAVADHVGGRMLSEEFAGRLRERIEHDERILQRLTGPACCCDRTTARLVVCPAHPAPVAPSVGKAGEERGE